MKKLFIAAALLGSLTSQLAFAKTEGNYVGIDAIYTQIRFDKINDDFADNESIGEGNQISLGVNYKYAFNFNNFFVAPGLFYDYTHTESIATGTFGLSATPFKDDLELNHRYGAKLDLGYDITNSFATYATIGVVNNSYRVLWRPQNLENNGNDVSALYGVGAKYSVTNNIDLSLGYEISNVDMKDIAGRKINYDVNVARAGVAYKF